MGRTVRYEVVSHKIKNDSGLSQLGKILKVFSVCLFLFYFCQPQETESLRVRVKRLGDTIQYVGVLRPGSGREGRTLGRGKGLFTEKGQVSQG